MRVDVDIKGTGSGGVGGSRVNWGPPGSVAAVPPFANLTVTNNKKTETKTVALFGHTHSINSLTELGVIANHLVPVHDIESELPVWNLGSSTGFWHWLFVSAIKFRSVSTHQAGSDLEVLSGKLHTDKDFYSDGCVSAGGIGTTPSPSGTSVEWETVVAGSYGTLTVDDSADTPVNLSIYGHNHDDLYYRTENTFNKQQVLDLIAGITGFEYVIVQTLPEPPGERTMYKIYLVPATNPATGNVYNEFITIRTGESPYTYSWEQIGSTAIDLNGYVTKVDLYDSNDIIKFSKLPPLYIGRTLVQSSNQPQELTGIVSIKSVDPNTQNDDASSLLKWETLLGNKAWHASGNFVADGFVCAGGMSDDAGNLPAVDWSQIYSTGLQIATITIGEDGAQVYVPFATTDRAGVVQVGSGLNINASGVLSVGDVGKKTFAELNDTTVINPSNNQIPFYDSTSQKWVNSGKNIGNADIPAYIKDNEAKAIESLRVHPEDNDSVVIPYMFNDLAYLITRGGSCTVEITSGSGTFTDNDKSNMFDCSPSYFIIKKTKISSNPDTYSSITLTVTLTLPSTLYHSQILYIDFGTSWWQPSSVTVRYGYNSTSTYPSQTKTGLDTPVVKFKLDAGQDGMNRIQIELSGWKSGAAQARIAEIGLINYESKGAQDVFMSRGVDDPVWRDITPSGTHSLGQNGTRWANIYSWNLFAQYLKLDNSPSVDWGSEYFLRDWTTKIAINTGNSSVCPTKSLVYCGKYSSDNSDRAHWFYGNVDTYNNELLLSLGAVNQSFKNFIPDQNSPGTWGKDLGANGNYWWRLFARRWYPGGVDNAYIDYSDTTTAVTNHGNFISTGSVTAGALGTGSSQGEVSDNIVPTSSGLTIGLETGNKFQYIYATNIGKDNSSGRISNIYANNAKVASLSVTGIAIINDSLQIDGLYSYLSYTSRIITDSEITDILAEEDTKEALLSGVYKAIYCSSTYEDIKMSIDEIRCSSDYSSMTIYFGKHRRLVLSGGTWTYYNYWEN